MKRKALNTTIRVALTAAFCAAPASAQQITGTPGTPSATEFKHRSHLPMPNTVRPSLVTYDAKNPDTKFPPIEQLRPPKGAPNVLIILIDDAGFGSSSAFGGPCQTPTAGKAGGGRTEVQPFPHHRHLLADPPGVAHRAQPPFRRHGRHHRDCDRRAGLQLGSAQLHGAPGGDAQTQRLLHRAVRQEPRSPRLADQPRRPL